MTRRAWQAALVPFFILTAICSGAPHARMAIKAQEAVSRGVSLDTVLSCPDDPLIRDVFQTDAVTATELNGAAMIMAKYHSSYRNKIRNYAALRSKMFFTTVLSGSEVSISPTDAQGNIVSEKNLPFCRDNPIAKYKSLTSSNEFPLVVAIPGTGWSLDANQVFLHADQFHFKSGVFADSSKVYLAASKGDTLIEFVPTSDGLRFYRAMYTRTPVR